MLRLLLLALISCSLIAADVPTRETDRSESATNFSLAAVPFPAGPSITAEYRYEGRVVARHIIIIEKGTGIHPAAVSLANSSVYQEISSSYPTAEVSVRLFSGSEVVLEAPLERFAPPGPTRQVKDSTTVLQFKADHAQEMELAVGGESTFTCPEPYGACDQARWECESQAYDLEMQRECDQQYFDCVNGSFVYRWTEVQHYYTPNGGYICGLNNGSLGFYNVYYRQTITKQWETRYCPLSFEYHTFLVSQNYDFDPEDLCYQFIQSTPTCVDLPPQNIGGACMI